MSVQPIRLFGDPVLRTPAEPVVDFDKELRTLVKDLHRDDAGRAGRRPGRPADRRRAARLHLPRRRRARAPDQPRPRPHRRRSRTATRAACRSPGWPSRPCGRYGVVAKGFDMHGEPVTIEGTELLARCVQHETDHLDGILFIDRLDRAQRKAALQGHPRGRVGRRGRAAGQAVARTPCTAGRSEPACASSSPARPRSPSRRWTRCSPPGTRSSAVVTRPDAPAGRGRTASRRPVAAAGRRGRHRGAQARQGLATRSFLERLRELAPDCCPVVAYGALRARRPRSTSRPHGWVNLHFSLLPAWRGAAPVQHAILHGDEVTGATDFLLEEGLDTGPVLRRDDRADPPARHQRRPARPARRLPAPACWSPPWTASSAASSTARPQPAEGVSLAPKVDRRRTPGSTGPRRRSRVDRLVRACTPAPGAWTTFARRPAQARPGRAGRRRRDLAPGRARGRPRDGPGRHRRPHAGAARRGAAGRASGRCRRPTGPAASAASTAGRWRDRPAPSPAEKARPRRAKPRPDLPPAGVGLRRCCGPSTSGTPTPTCVLPALLRERGLDARDAALRHRARLRHAARPGDVRRGARRLRRPAAGRGRPAGARRAPARRAPAARACGSRRTPRSAPRSSWPARWSARAAAGSSTRCCAGSPRTTSTAGWPRSRPPSTTDPVGHLAVVALAPALDRLGAARRARRRRSDETDGAAGGRQRARPRSPWWPGPGRATVAELAEAGRRARPLVAVRGRACRGGDPGGDPRGARRAGRGAGRGQPAGGARAGRGRRSRAPTSAGWTCAPGRAARRPCSARVAAGRGAALLAAEVAAAPGRPGRPGGRATRPASWWPTARAAGLARRPRSTGCSSTRPAPGWARCAAGRRPAGGAGRRTSPALTAAAGRAAARRPGRGAPRRRGRLRHLLAAPGRDPARSSRTCCAERAAGTGGARRRPAVPARRTRSRHGPDVQLWPHLHGTDAMYLSLLRRG